MQQPSCPVTGNMRKILLIVRWRALITKYISREGAILQRILKGRGGNVPMGAWGITPPPPPMSTKLQESWSCSRDLSVHKEVWPNLNL